MITFLENLGLSEKEAKVYLAALELGASSVQEIGKKAGVNRATTYFILESLAKLGLTSSYEKDKKTFFTAEAPEQLDNLLKKQEENIEDNRVELKKNIPELQAIFNLAVGKPKVKFYEGIDGLKAMQQDSLRAKITNIYSFTPLDKYMKAFPEQNAVIERIKRKWSLKVIYTSLKGPTKEASDKKSFREARFVPIGEFPFESMIDIFPEKGIRIYNFDPYFSGVMIEDKNIAKTFKSIFDLSWAAAEKYN